ncbi:MAG: RraA family protein [Dehalococcoidia bacterium]
MSEPSIPLEELAERYKKLYTPAIADILDEKGLLYQILPPSIQALAPSMRVAGPALTVKGTPTIVNKEEYLQLMLQAYLAMQPGVVAVYDTSADQMAAHWGELVSTAASVKGCRGAVIDGGVRDVERIIEMGFPVFARYRSPADIRGRWRYVEVNVPIRVGDVLIQPGDFVVGDANGVVVVPQHLTVDVLLEAESVVETEDKIRQELRAGENPLTLYQKYQRF